MISIEKGLCKGCFFCIEFCPKKILKKSKKINLEGFFSPEILFPEKCIKCRNCELVCPELAISIGD